MLEVSDLHISDMALFQGQSACMTWFMSRRLSKQNPWLKGNEMTRTLIQRTRLSDQGCHLEGEVGKKGRPCEHCSLKVCIPAMEGFYGDWDWNS